MGEAAPCLMRSASHPSFASCGFKEGDRLRALTTSVSFGRFMTEPLDWEKWSSFSHNRTLEDVQKHSRPGAVAEKKAFFEAYYKNFAAKPGAKPPKKENKPPKFSDIDENKPSKRGIQPETSSDKDACLPSTTNLGFLETGNVDDNNLSTCQVEREKTSTENASSPSTNLDFSETGNVNDIISITCHVEQEQTTENVISASAGLVSSNSEVNSETTSKKDVCLPSATLVHSEIVNVDGVISSASQVEPSTDRVFSQCMDVKDEASNSRWVELEIISKEDVALPRNNLVFSENRSMDDMITCSRQMEDEKTSTENVSLEKHQFQDRILNHVEKNKKRQIKDKISVQTVQKKAEISCVKSLSREAPIAEIQHKKAARDVTEKKKSVLQSLHLSIKLPASLNKNLNLETLSKPKDRAIQQALTRVSSVNGVKKNSQVLPRPENKRSKPLLNCSLNDSKTTVLKSLSTNHSEALVVSSKKPRSTTVFSSFSFRSDERAVKRKEFFQKLEEKSNTNQTKKTQLQPELKEKGRNDNGKLPWTTVLQAKPKPCTSETKRPRHIIQKVQPKLGKKNFIEINKRSISRSMACL